MRIAVLAHGLQAAGGKSVGVNVLAALSRVRPEHRYLLVVPEQEEYRNILLPPHAEVVAYREAGIGRRMLFEQLQLPRLVKRFGPDMVWGLGNMGLADPPGFQSVLLHKAQMVYPAKYRPAEVLRRRLVNQLIRWQLRHSLARTQVVFCQTDVMRRRFSEVFRYPGRTELMPNAVSLAVQRTPGVAVPPELRAIHRPIKLFVLTRYYAQKNLEAIVECFERYRQELADVACVLTIAPDQHPRAARLLERIESAGLGEAIVNVGPLDQQRLAAFYEHTDALLLPTLLESFSGTYLEAMACECPILTSDLDFAREVCGDAALYFDPWSPAAMKDAILRINGDQALVDKLVGTGRRRRAEFSKSWDEIVDSALSVLEETVKSGAAEGHEREKPDR